MINKPIKILTSKDENYVSVGDGQVPGEGVACPLCGTQSVLEWDIFQFQNFCRKVSALVFARQAVEETLSLNV